MCSLCLRLVSRWAHSLSADHARSLAFLLLVIGGRQPEMMHLDWGAVWDLATRQTTLCDLRFDRETRTPWSLGSPQFCTFDASLGYFV